MRSASDSPGSNAAVQAGPARSGAEVAPERPANDPRRNDLLASLPDADLQRLRSWLEPIALRAGQALYESGSVLGHGYFPLSAIVSLQYVTENGASAQIAVVGREGIVGIPIFMGGGSTPSRAVVQTAGVALRISGPALREAFANSAPLMKQLLRYTQALIAQMGQVAVCNRHHSLDQQLCRWLLLSLDRQVGDELVVTQEQIAHMLGVRREGVTEAALALQRAELIRYRRGHIVVLDRQGLERRSCECYAVVKAEYDRLLLRSGPT